MDSFLCPWEKHIHFFKIQPLNIQTPNNADDGQLFLAQWTDSHRIKVNLANADACLSTVCCNKPMMFVTFDIYFID